MADFLVAAAGLLLLIVATGFLGLWRTGAIGRMTALQLLGTCGIAVLLLLCVAHEDVAVLDVALLLAVLAACTVAAFRAYVLKSALRREGRAP